MPFVDFLAFLLSIIDRIIVPMVFAIAFLVFIWGVFQAFILNGSDVEKQKNGRSLVLYGVLGFFFMLSVWGLTRVLVNTFGFQNQGRPPIPHFNLEEQKEKTALSTVFHTHA
jgi:Type IV secretion system pilin